MSGTKMSEHETWLSSFKPIPIPEYLAQSVKEFSNRPAIDYMGKSWSYQELGDLVDRATLGLQNLGVKKGDKVGICLPNTPYYPICHYAILKAGGVVVNFNPLYAVREFEHQIKDSEIKLMVTFDLTSTYEKIEQIHQDGLFEKIIVCPLADILPQPKRFLFNLLRGRTLSAVKTDDSHFSFEQLIAEQGQPEPVEIDPENDFAILQYTGGTTGVPKGAILTHRNLSANIEQVRHVFKMARPGEERNLCVLPFFHVFAMNVGQYLSVLIGAEMVLMPRFELKGLLKLIQRKKITLFPGVPTIYNAINNSGIQHNYDLSSIRLCVSGGAPLPVEVKEKFESLSNCILVEGYGLTEASPIVAANPLDDTNVPGSIGQPLIGTEVQFCALEGEESDSDNTKRTKEGTWYLKDGEKGELCVQGPQVMKGYWKRTEDTERAMRNGFFHTGDVGYRDKDGFIFLVDRIKDLILCSGHNVYPRVIEDALYCHDDVLEAIVIGIPDNYRGEAPKAFVKVREGSTITPDDLIDFLQFHLSVIEMPQEIEFRDVLPKTIIGKLSKKELIEEEREKSEEFYSKKLDSES